MFHQLTSECLWVRPICREKARGEKDKNEIVDKIYKLAGIKEWEEEISMKYRRKYEMG